VAHLYGHSGAFCGLKLQRDLYCELVGYDAVVRYDTLYTDEGGPVYFVRLGVMTLCIMTSVDQFIL